MTGSNKSSDGCPGRTRLQVPFDRMSVSGAVNVSLPRRTVIDRWPSAGGIAGDAWLAIGHVMSYESCAGGALSEDRQPETDDRKWASSSAG